MSAQAVKIDGRQFKSNAASQRTRLRTSVLVVARRAVVPLNEVPSQKLLVSLQICWE